MSEIQSYFGNIKNSVTSVFEGMAVTMSWMFREPMTTQYPYHPSKPDVKLGGPETLPDRYRGLLEVDMDICTACLACERSCPIDCIKIDVEKVRMSEDETDKPVRAMTRFDIDMAKCMYCGLCSEPCPTNAIRHTKEFESTVAHLEHLTARFVAEEEPVVPFKVKKGADYDSTDHGTIAHTIYTDREWDLGPIDFPDLPRKSKKKKDDTPPDWFSRPLSERAQSAKNVSVPQLAQILEDSMAGTDCGACEYPTCKEYSVAIANDQCGETWRCEPGGADAQIEAGQIMAVFQGLNPEKAKEDKAAAVAAAAAAPVETPAEVPAAEEG